MFGKKCNNCDEKITGKYNFCPSCGSSIKESRKKDFGMLGENDFEETQNLGRETFIERLGGKMMGKMFESAMKMLENEMTKEMNKQRRPNTQGEPKNNFQLFINGKKINISQMQPKKEKEIVEKNPIELPNEPLKNYSKFPKKEPKTNIRRLSDKVVYEVSMPGIKTEKDISIVNLENSIEIKGVGKEVAYQKILPVSLPITGYNLSRGKLVLELGIKD